MHIKLAHVKCSKYSTYFRLNESTCFFQTCCLVKCRPCKRNLKGFVEMVLQGVSAEEQEVMLNLCCRIMNSPATWGWCWTWGAWNIDVIIATLYIRRVTNVYLLRGETIMTDKPDEKAKTYRIDRKLAIELEVYARQKQVSEVSLVRRYIQEGLRRDKGQTTLDEWKNKRRKRKKENSIKTSNAD